MPDVCDDHFKKTTKVLKKIFPKAKLSVKTRKTIRAGCEKTYMNPGCKDTMFEDGPANKLPKSSDSLIKKIMKKDKKFAKIFLNELKKERKELFGKRKTILKDNFYYKLSNKTVRNLKKKGATSGCTRFDEN
jgi:hypothetical protein